MYKYLVMEYDDDTGENRAVRLVEDFMPEYDENDYYYLKIEADGTLNEVVEPYVKDMSHTGYVVYEWHYNPDEVEEWELDIHDAVILEKRLGLYESIYSEDARSALMELLAKYGFSDPDMARYQFFRTGFTIDFPQDDVCIIIAYVKDDRKLESYPVFRG